MLPGLRYQSGRRNTTLVWGEQVRFHELRNTIAHTYPELAPDCMIAARNKLRETLASARRCAPTENAPALSPNIVTYRDMQTESLLRREIRSSRQEKKLQGVRTFVGWPPKAAICFWTHSSANRWSSKPGFMATSPKLCERSSMAGPLRKPKRLRRCMKCGLVKLSLEIKRKRSLTQFRET